jgi:hypothetical protein
MAISKEFRNSGWVMRNNEDVKIRCPVEEIGRNSVMPSTIPKIIAVIKFIFLFVNVC